jgi:hypothetical protein
VTSDAKTQNNDAQPLVRRAAAVALGVTAGSLALPALATPNDWADTDNPSLVGALLLIGGPVLAVLAVITLLTYLPSMMRRGSDVVAYDDPEWFGGPRTGVKGEDQEVAEGTGGTGGRW